MFNKIWVAGIYGSAMGIKDPVIAFLIITVAK